MILASEAGSTTSRSLLSTFARHHRRDPIEARAILTTGKSVIVLLLAAVVLMGAAAARGFEYDEAYSVFVTSPTARPAWPDTVFRAGDVRAAFTTHAGPLAIARALRATDVHPPLYFWALAGWRRVAGDGLLAMRLLSVLCALGALAAVGGLARDGGIAPALAMLLTAGCYGFAYTAVVARGFALAQLLSLCGVLLLSRARGAPAALGGGMLLGAATFTNYLSAFTGCAALGWMVLSGGRPSAHPAQRLLAALVGFAAFLPGDLWFILAQRGSRPGQFPPFHLGPSLVRMARYAAANLFGGLPLYVEGSARLAIVGALAALALGLAGLVAARWRHMQGGATRWLLLAGAAATPAGLLLLGVAFDNTPIELRYLCFATPFVALLLAGALGSLRLGRALAAGVLAIQALAIAGLILRPETMQPARAAARAAAVLAGEDGVVLLPRGNDGVGVAGPFLAELPERTRVLLVAPDWRIRLPAGRVVTGDDRRGRGEPRDPRGRRGAVSRSMPARGHEPAAGRGAGSTLQEDLYRNVPR